MRGRERERTPRTSLLRKHGGDVKRGKETIMLNDGGVFLAPRQPLDPPAPTREPRICPPGSQAAAPWAASQSCQPGRAL